MELTENNEIPNIKIIKNVIHQILVTGGWFQDLAESFSRKVKKGRKREKKIKASKIRVNKWQKRELVGQQIIF